MTIIDSIAHDAVPETGSMMARKTLHPIKLQRGTAALVAFVFMAGTVRRIFSVWVTFNSSTESFLQHARTHAKTLRPQKSAKTYPDCNEETNCPSSVLKFWPGCSCDAFHEVGCGTCVFSMPWPLNLPKISEWSVFVSCTWTQYACDVI